jgi:hypothetical protein
MKALVVKSCWPSQTIWRKMLRLGLLTLATLNPPAFLLAQNPARGIKFERIGLNLEVSKQ